MLTDPLKKLIAQVEKRPGSRSGGKETRSELGSRVYAKRKREERRSKAMKEREV